MLHNRKIHQRALCKQVSEIDCFESNVSNEGLQNNLILQQNIIPFPTNNYLRNISYLIPHRFSKLLQGHSYVYYEKAAFQLSHASIFIILTLLLKSCDISAGTKFFKSFRFLAVEMTLKILIRSSYIQELSNSVKLYMLW